MGASGPALRTVSLRELNRWTLARQMLLERVPLDAVSAIERLAGMQAQYSPSPYIGLWSRLTGFRREELEAAILEDRVLKATLMRGTLHLISARHFDLYRVCCRSQYDERSLKLLRERGVDVEALRTATVAALSERPLRRAEVSDAVRHLVPEDLPGWVALSTVALHGEIMNIADDARFGYFGGSRYRLVPPPAVDAADAYRHVAAAYLAAFGPASRADLAAWTRQTLGRFSAGLESLNLVKLRAEDGRVLLDLADGPRPDPDIPAPVRFLPKWDNVLLGYARRERILPDAFRKIVIGKNGDVLPTFLVDGIVAGAWDAPLRGRAVMTLSAFGPISARDRREVETEGAQLLAWLRPDTDRRELRWLDATPSV